MTNQGVNRLGRNRLAKDLLRDLLRELYCQHLQGESGSDFQDEDEAKKAAAAALKLAERQVTEQTMARWIQAQGAVAADPDRQPLDKVATISSALLAKLDECGLRTLFTEAQSRHVTAMLTAIVMQPDAETYHEGLRERVVAYIFKEVLEVSPEDGSDAVKQALNGVDKTLMRLRVGEIDAYQTQALLFFHIGWVACELGASHRTLVAGMLQTEAHLWELISPYHVES